MESHQILFYCGLAFFGLVAIACVLLWVWLLRRAHSSPGEIQALAALFMFTAYGALLLNFSLSLRDDGKEVISWRDVAIAVAIVCTTWSTAAYLWLTRDDGVWSLVMSALASCALIAGNQSIKLGNNDLRLYWIWGAIAVFILQVLWMFWKTRRNHLFSWVALIFLGVGTIGVGVVQLLSHTTWSVVSYLLQEILYLVFTGIAFGIGSIFLTYTNRNYVFNKANVGECNPMLPGDGEPSTRTAKQLVRDTNSSLHQRTRSPARPDKCD